MPVSSKPLVSVIIPTLNAAAVLQSCLHSIDRQTLTNYEIILADGGSVDQTLTLAQKYHCQIVANPLKTAEAGKAIAIRHAIGKYVALIDSDNILPTKNWLQQMIAPLENDTNLIGSEPIAFTYRRQAGFIERYSALFGANDPYAFVVGISDRLNYLNYHWTGLKIDSLPQKKFLRIKLVPHQPIPTIGANGTVFRRQFLQKNFSGDYLFDIDLITSVLNQTQQPLYFAKTNNSIIHTYCEASIKKFIRKQTRRLTDYYYYQPLRSFAWNQTNNNSLPKFIFYTIFILPALIDSIQGYIKKPDPAWFFHPLACLITLYCYSLITLKKQLGLLSQLNRQQWQQ